MTMLKLGNKEIEVPPLTLGQLRNGVLKLMQEHDEQVKKQEVFEAMITKGKIIATALRRLYPDVSEDEVLDALDMKTAPQIWLDVLGASGFAPGEVQAAIEETKSGT